MLNYTYLYAHKRLKVILLLSAKTLNAFAEEFQCGKRLLHTQ